LPTVSPAGTGLVPRRSFDALFLRALSPSPALAGALRELGYSPEEPREEYPLHVWCQALELTRQDVYGTLEPAEGYRRLGERFADGFHDTLLGRVFATSVARLGPERYLLRLPTFMRTTRAGLTAVVQANGPGDWTVDVTDSQPLPEFVAGTIERTLQVAGAMARVEVARADVDGYQLSVRW
jgi:uncharacterized protein (TIGR02265 family)